MPIDRCTWDNQSHPGVRAVTNKYNELLFGLVPRTITPPSARCVRPNNKCFGWLREGALTRCELCRRRPHGEETKSCPKFPEEQQ